MKITIYSTRTCMYCYALKTWLDQKSIKYTEKLVDENHDAAKKMIELSGQMGVPFSTIEHDDGHMDKILGFDRQKFDSALKASS